MAQDWPILGVAVAFTGDPNNASATYGWTDITSRVLEIKTKQGREYELSNTEAGDCTFTLNNDDGALDPTNTSSPYYPNVTPYRRIRVAAQYGTGNILNDQNSNHPDAPVIWSDSSFEVGISHWTANGPTVLPVLVRSTADKHDGTTSMLMTCGANALNASGVANLASLNVPTILGQQYTFSTWLKVNALPASGTVGILVNGIAFGPTTTTVGSWLQLSMTFTAVDWYSTVGVYTGGAATTSSHSLYIDSVVVNPGASATPYRHIWVIDGGVRTTAVDGWITQTANVQVSQALNVGLNDNNSLAVVTSATATPVVNAYLSGTYGFPVTPTQKVALQVQGLATVAGRTMRLSAYFYNSGGTLLSLPQIGTDATLSTTQWTQIAGTVTVPATAATCVLNVTFPSGMGANETAYLTNGMFESNVASVGDYADTYTGTLVQPLFTGYVERWPMKFLNSGFQSRVEITAVDTLGVYGLTRMKNCVVADFQQDYVTSGTANGFKASYWPLTENLTLAQTTGTQVGGQQGSSNAVLTLTQTGAGGVAALGSTTYITAADGLTGLTLTPTTVTTDGAYLKANLTGTQTVGGLNLGVTFEMAFKANANASGNTLMICWPSSRKQNSTYYFSSSVTASGYLWNIWYDGIGSSGATFIGSTNLIDNAVHHFAVTWAPTATGYTLTSYLDGVVQYNGAYPDTPYTTPIMDSYLIGGPAAGASFGRLFSGTIGHIAMHPTALSASRIASHAAAIRTGFTGDTTGARINRLLGWANFNGPKSIATGNSTLGPASSLEGATLPDALQSAADTESGLVYVDGGGRVTFTSRQTRFSANTNFVAGEKDTFGELPYDSDIAFDYDPQKVYNQIQFSRNQGVSTNVSDVTSQAKYFQRVLNRTLYMNTDTEVVSAANWFLNRYKDPHLRVSVLEFDLATLSRWQQLLPLALSQKLQVKRRTTAGNVVTLDAFLELLEHHITPDSWKISAQATPASFSTGWIMGNSAIGNPLGPANPLAPANINSIIGQTTTVAY
jgi:hypothetical protein